MYVDFNFRISGYVLVEIKFKDKEEKFVFVCYLNNG